MPSFSERFGHKPLKPYQTDEIDVALDASIWNFLVHGIFPNYKSDWVIKSLGVHFFKDKDVHHPLSWKNVQSRYDWIRQRYDALNWYEKYDFLEFVYRQLIVWEESPNSSARKVSGEQFVHNLNKNVLETERSGFMMVKGEIVPVTNEIEMNEIKDALDASETHRWKPVHDHIANAISKLSEKPMPDLRNAVKEAASAIESVIGIPTGVKPGDINKQLDALAGIFPIHGAMKNFVSNVFGFASDTSRHGLLTPKEVSLEDARLAVITASAVVNHVISSVEKRDAKQQQ